MWFYILVQGYHWHRLDKQLNKNKSWKVRTLLEDSFITTKLLPVFSFNIKILYLLIVHRVLWKRNSMKSGKGVTFYSKSLSFNLIFALNTNSRWARLWRWGRVPRRYQLCKFWWRPGGNWTHSFNSIQIPMQSVQHGFQWKRRICQSSDESPQKHTTT